MFTNTLDPDTGKIVKLLSALNSHEIVEFEVPEIANLRAAFCQIQLTQRPRGQQQDLKLLE